MDISKLSLHKVLSVILALLFTFSSLAYAEDSAVHMTASSEIISFIKEQEGFSQYQYGDASGYSIGYGTNCEYNEYPMGVSEGEAHELLVEHLTEIEKKLDAVMELRGFTLTQPQFDALLSFSYNVGTAWMDTSIRLYSYIISGVHNYTDTEFASAMGIWCHIGTEIDYNLLKRRIREIQIFLYGDYTGQQSSDFKWVVYDAGSGKPDYDVGLYKLGDGVGTMPGASLEGYAFEGWYTDDGSELVEYNAMYENITVNAKWSSTGVSGSDGGEENAELEALRAYYDSLIDVSDWQNPFRDALADAWYYKYVGALYKAKVVSGYPDGSFRPNGNVTCGEALVLILNAAGCGAQAPTSEHWASGYLSLALEQGFIDNGDIRDLDAKISRSLIAKLAARSLGIYSALGASPFADTNDTYAVALYENHIISGSYAGNDLVFLPASFTTRGQISVIVWNMMLSKLEAAETAVNKPGYEAPPDSYLSSGKIDFMGHTVYIDSSLDLTEYKASDFLKTSDGRVFCTDPNAKTGIDVSAWQGDIDWNAVAADGIDFAIIRVGYRGYTEGGIFLDPYFNRNIEGALSAGLEVGVYFYSQAVSVEEAIEEAEFTLDCIADYRISYPVVFDWEPVSDPESRTNTYDGALITSCAEAFCQRISGYGYAASVYFNCTLGYLKYNLAELTQYDFWLAEYKTAPTFIYAVDMWQYSSSVMINGINRTVDMNICYKNY